MRTLIVCLLVAGVGTAAAVGLTRPGRELTGELGLPTDVTYAVVLGGMLFEARTLSDSEGAPDVGYLTSDAPLTATVTETGGVARVGLLVDGRLQAVRMLPCPRRGCAHEARVRFLPRVIIGGVGSHRIVVVAAGPGATRMTPAAAFTVNVGARPATPLEVEPRASVAPDPGDAGRRSRVDQIVQAAARRGPLARLIGRSRLLLREHGRGGGVVTVLADVRPTRRSVAASLPQVDEDALARGQIRALRDLVIDVDVAHRRLVGLQPGPASEVSAWASPAAGPHDTDDAPSTTFAPRRTPRLLQLSDRGPSFFTQDGDPVLRANSRDWPVSLLFTGNASVGKVKAGLQRLGLGRRGHARFLGYQTPGGALRFDADRGLKNACDATATDLHARVYAPSRTDRFQDPDLGNVVVATVHLDHVDGCGSGPPLFGFSERAERRLAGLIQTGLHWKVRTDAYPLGNAEPLRRDAADASHVWLSNGLATGVQVP